MSNGATINQTIDHLLAQARSETKVATLETRSTAISRADAFRKLAHELRTLPESRLTFDTLYRVKQVLYGH